MSAADGKNTDGSGLASAADRVKGRLDALQAERQAASQQRRAAAADASDPEQDTRSFQLRLEAVRRDVNSSLDALRGDASGGGSAPPSLDASQRAEVLRTALERVSELEQDASRCALFLPKYDLRAALDLVASLRDQLHAAHAAFAPKKRFAFGTRAAAPAVPAVRVVPAPSSTMLPEQESVSIAVEEEDAPSCPGLRHAVPGSVHAVTLPQLGGDAHADGGAEYAVEDCTDCTVTVIAPLRALRLRRLTGCTILVLAVSGACYVEHCTDCKLHIACHQTRIHDTTDTQLYLRCRSRPIIERCHGVLFAPLFVPKLSAEARFQSVYSVLDASALGDGDADAWREAWSSVDDFGWHRIGHSPHWRVLDQKERVAPPSLVPAGSGTRDGSIDEEI